MRPLIGLFHFNVQYVAGNPPGYHRYCTEALHPFLDAVVRVQNWRVTFEMAGCGLEFVAQFYPDLLRKIRLLIDRGQLELISSTYVPSLWVAFPGLDLIKSIELNIDCLERLGLPRSRVFFAQEGFFGLGLKRLDSYFDAVLCKDDYLSHFIGAELMCPAYRLGNLKVIVGSNHLLNECRRRLLHGPILDEGLLYAGHLTSASDNISPAWSRDTDGTHPFWYHFGSGHHFSVPAVPGDWDNFFAARDWISVTQNVINSYAQQGFNYSFISEFADSLSLSALYELPKVIEGSWNAGRSDGVFVWMGKHKNIWENNAGGLALTWRARNRLMRLREATDRLNDPEMLQRLNATFAELWKLLLFAESSDSFGWAPTPNEAVFASNYAEELLRQIAIIESQLTAHEDFPLPFPTEGPVLRPVKRLTAAWLEPPYAIELFGSSGHIDRKMLDTNTVMLEARFTPQDVSCGVLFGTCFHEVIYCPSGIETSPVQLNLKDLRPDTIYLPLANGLLGIGDERYIIRCNEYGQVAACINKMIFTVSFRVEGPCAPRQYRWRFIVFRGSLDKALHLANLINCAGG